MPSCHFGEDLQAKKIVYLRKQSQLYLGFLLRPALAYLRHNLCTATAYLCISCSYNNTFVDTKVSWLHISNLAAIWDEALLAHAGGAELYEAGVQLKEIIRGRAVLLLADRTDIADAVEADGVALSGKGASSLPVAPHSKFYSALPSCIVNCITSIYTLHLLGFFVIMLKDCLHSF